MKHFDKIFHIQCLLKNMGKTQEHIHLFLMQQQILCLKIIQKAPTLDITSQGWFIQLRSYFFILFYQTT